MAKKKEWIELCKTESRLFPCRHKMLLIANIEQLDMLRIMWELISWDPKGHVCKFISTQNHGRYVLGVVYAGQKFRRAVMRVARHWAPTAIFASGEYAVSVHVTRGEFNLLAGERRAYSSEELQAARARTISNRANLKFPKSGHADPGKILEAFSDFYSPGIWTVREGTVWIRPKEQPTIRFRKPQDPDPVDPYSSLR